MNRLTPRGPVHGFKSHEEWVDLNRMPIPPEPRRMNAAVRDADILHSELYRARRIVAAAPLQRVSASATRNACEYLLRNGDAIDRSRAKKMLRELDSTPAFDRDCVLVWGSMGIGLALFFIFIGIPAFARFIQWGGNIVAGWL